MKIRLPRLHYGFKPLRRPPFHRRFGDRFGHTSRGPPEAAVAHQGWLDHGFGADANPERRRDNDSSHLELVRRHLMVGQHQDDSWRATAQCNRLLTSTKCDHWHIIFDRGLRFTPLNNQKRGVCHEIGHSLGFDDSQPEPGQGCMSGGGLRRLSGHEIHHIDEQY